MKSKSEAYKYEEKFLEGLARRKKILAGLEESREENKALIKDAEDKIAAIRSTCAIMSDAYCEGILNASMTELEKSITRYRKNNNTISSHIEEIKKRD